MENITLFGNRLKIERKRLGLTQAEVAEKCGISRETWGMYERGQIMPGSSALLSFSALGADMNYLFTGVHGNDVKTSLSNKELSILDDYRQSTDEGKETIANVAKALSLQSQTKDRKVG